MARLGPWDGERRVAVAVSGGPDSLALAVLAQAWGNPTAFIVDHGLRPDSATEAEGVRAALVARGIPAEILTLGAVRRGPALAARARTARYAALAAACRAAGLVDLLLGHHAGDQAETVLMRQRGGSGPAGLAGMAAVVERHDVRLLRPLLFATPDALRAAVAEAGLVPAADPSNDDPASTRVLLRREIGTERAALLEAAARHGTARRHAEQDAAALLAARASFYPEGFAVLQPGPIAGLAAGALLRSLSGRPYPVSAPVMPGVGTRGGVRILPAGRAGEGWLLVREAAAMQAPVPAVPGAVWDNRFRLAAGDGGGELGAVGDDAALLRAGSALPSAVLRSLPALRVDGALSAVPHLHYGMREAVRVGARGGAGRGIVLTRVGNPASGAPFAVC